jgi:hypothetical protein
VPISQGKWCKNKHGASKIIDTFEAYQSPSGVLSFSYWIDYLGFITEGKLAAIFIKLSLGVSNWLVILLYQQTQSSFLASSSPRHQLLIASKSSSLRAPLQYNV